MPMAPASVGRKKGPQVSPLLQTTIRIRRKRPWIRAEEIRGEDLVDLPVRIRGGLRPLKGTPFAEELVPPLVMVPVKEPAGPSES